MNAHLRLFVLTAVFVLIIGAGQYVRHLQVHDLENLTVGQSAELAKTFASTMYAGIQPLLDHEPGLDPFALRGRPEVQGLDNALMVVIKQLNVAKIKIYDQEGMTVFSTQFDQIGEDMAGNKGFRGAMDGETAGSIVYRGTFNAFDKLLEKRSLVQAYVPIREPMTDEIQGVLEMYSDITPLLEWINTSQNRVQWATLAGMLISYVVLVLVFRRMDHIRSGMRRDVTGLKEELDRNKQVLEERVTEWTRELQASSAFLETVLDGLPDPIWVIDKDFHICAMNRAAVEWDSAGGNGPCGARCYEILHHRNLPCDEPEHPCTLRRVIATEQPCTLLHTHYGQDGVPRLIEVRGAPLRDAEGSLTGVLELMHDITAREEMHKELQQAKEMAEVSLAARSRCLSNITHELSTPMNAVIGMIDVLRRTPLNAQQLQYLRIMANSGHVLAGLFEDLLGWSKYESGEGDLRRDELDPRLVVDTVLDILAPRAGQKGLELLSFVEPAVPSRLLGDFGAIRQILLNLVGNATKFTNDGHVQVRIALAEREVDRCRLHVRVSDTGVGVPDDLVPTIFERFQQGANAARSPEIGAGLGLSICRTLVERMGGTIGVQRNPDRGTTFWLDIWLDFPTDSQDEAPVAELTLEGARVLLACGSEATRVALAEQVGAIGGRSGAAKNAADCLMALYQAIDAGDPYAAAVVDNDLPGTSGEDLARAIKTDWALGAVRVLVLRPLADPVPAAQQDEIGFEAQLSKPLKQSKLANVLVELTHASAEAAPAAADAREPERVEDATEVLGPVLLVDDNPVNRHVAQLLVDQLGFDADCADSGERALELLATRRYGLVLMDCQMPGMDGISTTMEVRRREGAGAATPIVAMTALTEAAEHRRCLAAGMDDALRKPVTEANLKKILNRWLPVARRNPDDPVWGVLNPSLWENMKKTEERQPDFLPRLTYMFVKHTEESLARARVYLEKGEAEPLARAAHEIVGACSQVGADRLMAIGRSAEAYASEPEVATILVERMERELERVRQALIRVSAAGKSGAQASASEAAK